MRRVAKWIAVGVVLVTGYWGCRAIVGLLPKAQEPYVVSGEYETFPDFRTIPGPPQPSHPGA